MFYFGDVSNKTVVPFTLVGYEMTIASSGVPSENDCEREVRLQPKYQLARLSETQKSPC